MGPPSCGGGSSGGGGFGGSASFPCAGLAGSCVHAPRDPAAGTSSTTAALNASARARSATEALIGWLMMITFDLRQSECQDVRRPRCDAPDLARLRSSAQGLASGRLEIDSMAALVEVLGRAAPM